MQGDEQYPCPDIIACILLRGVRCLLLVACCFVAAIIVRLCDLPVFHVCWPCASLVPVTLPEVNRVPGFLHAICGMPNWQEKVGEKPGLQFTQWIEQQIMLDPHLVFPRILSLGPPLFISVVPKADICAS